MGRPSYRVVGGGQRGFGFLGGNAPPPPDLIAILAVLVVTWAMQFLGGAAAIELFRLTPMVYQGWVWQLATYPFVGIGIGGMWGGVLFLVVLLMIYWFGRDVLWRLGRRRFWKQLAVGVLGAALTAVVVQFLIAVIGLRGVTSVPMFFMMQGQHTLFVILLAMFATLNAEATILLFFVLPMKARWFLWLEVALAFFWFTSSRDLAGFFGLCAAIFITFAGLSPGGPRQLLWRWRKRLEKLRLERRLARMRRERKLNVVDDRDRWVH